VKNFPTRLILCILGGCASAGNVSDTHASAQIKAEGDMLDEGLKDGLWSIWQEDGVQQAEDPFVLSGRQIRAARRFLKRPPQAPPGA
jgi:hypothetical protein